MNRLAPLSQIISVTLVSILFHTWRLEGAGLQEAERKNTSWNEIFSVSNHVQRETLAELVAESTSDGFNFVLHDYGLQFLGTALERSDLSDSDVQLAHAALDATLANTNGTFAGTALRSLRRAAVAHSDDALAAHVSSNALRIACDSAYSPESRTTALLILEESHSPATFSIARGIQGEAPSSPLLHKTAEAVVKRLETAAQPSLSAIESATMSPE